MSSHDVGAPDDSSGDADIIDALFDGINSTIQTIADIIFEAQQRAADDPCFAEIQTRDAISILNDGIATAKGRLGQIAEIGQGSVVDAIEQWGRVGGTGYISATVTPFPKWLEDSGTMASGQIQALGTAFGGLIGFIIASVIARDFISDRLPAPGTVPSAENKGFQMAPGVYLYAEGYPLPNPGSLGPKAAAHIEHGTFQGLRIRQEYDSWLRFIKANAAPAAAHSWRQALAGTAGDDGTWRIWSAGDPIDPGSQLGELLNRRATQEGREDGYAHECWIQRRWERGESEKEQWLTGLTPYFLGSAAALAWILGRRR